ncbi:MAG: hypothetical protein P4M15_06185, partial [Alphaproteobacteria bacterium]|nr:hypothetical protein [Alphaproteobacteria bacterium]
MSDTESQNPLAERALQRLRKLATGNGLEPAAITVLEIQEQVFVLEALMQVSPVCETRSITYAGSVRGKDRKVLRDTDTLNQEVARHQRSFRENPGWISAVTEEIKSHESRGWGLEDAKVTLPEKSGIYAVTETCPSCQGRQMLTCMQCQGVGTVICTQCQGQGREMCYHCGGRGEDPHQPGQKCPTCNGTRYAPCRFCQTRGQLPCPTCQGQRGTQCSTCAGSGRITQEVTVECGAQTHFKLIAGNLPSGLRRGIERIGIDKIGKGHADIAVTKPAPAEESAPDKTPISILAYRAALPYAEMRMSFGSKKAIISAVGKRCALMGVPNFLDDALAPGREKLKQAAGGHGALESALDLRALREILALSVSGRGTPEAVRKIYPFGLSNEAVSEILTHTRLAINK